MNVAVAFSTPSTGRLSRPVVYRTRGQRHGPITRLMSPGDVGELVKPFIFLDLFESEGVQGRGFAPHPHSGIATLTTFLEGAMTYADSTGKDGALSAGSVEWMQAGSGVWHAGEPMSGEPMRGYQLWLALPPSLELAAPVSQYLEPGVVPAAGPVRVLLGAHEGHASPIALPVGIKYLHVRLADGEAWTYRPDADHEVAWLALNRGQLETADVMLEREIAVFAEGNAPIHLVAHGEVELVIGSAVKHPHPLVSGYYSVHTSADALSKGEDNIKTLGRSAAVAALHRRK